MPVSRQLPWLRRALGLPRLAVRRAPPPAPLKSSILGKLTTAALLSGAAGSALFYYYKDPNASIHEYVILPIVRLLYDGESSHRLAIEIMKYPSLNPTEKPSWNDEHDPHQQLAVRLFEHSANPKVRRVDLRTPLGVAAGLDKNGEAIDSLFNLGFSYVEIGSITPEAQPGNPLPRFFRLEKDKAVINRYGFNSEGHIAVLARLKTRLAAAGVYNDTRANEALHPGRALAVSLGKNKTSESALDDYVKGVQAFGPYADVLVVNVSSPNTPGLRSLQAEEQLKTLLSGVVEERNRLDLAVLPPVVVKVAPDLTEPEIESIAAAVKATNVDGVIVSNTTIARPSGLKSDRSIVSEVGGLSGPPIKPYSLQAVRLMRKHLGSDVTLIGCGGIATGADALEYARAGASFVQLYTAFAYKGPAIVGSIKRDVLNGLDGRKWSDIVGEDAK